MKPQPTNEPTAVGREQDEEELYEALTIWDNRLGMDSGDVEAEKGKPAKTSATGSWDWTRPPGFGDKKPRKRPGR